MPATLTQIIVRSIVGERIPVRCRVGFARRHGAHHGRLILIKDSEVAERLDLGRGSEIDGHGSPFVGDHNVSVPLGSDITRAFRLLENGPSGQHLIAAG